MTITRGFGFTFDTQTGRVERWAFAGEPTGHPPGMLQDDSRELTAWLAGRPDAMMRAREAAAAIGLTRSEPGGAHEATGEVRR